MAEGTATSSRNVKCPEQSGGSSRFGSGEDLFSGLAAVLESMVKPIGTRVECHLSLNGIAKELGQETEMTCGPPAAINSL